ncbi:Flp family type IVb pilin [Albirhodobacter sp. R86504]|uniref:Flp family type IVb pilin n=1 Tax=Albirhodobacter sp. R86504 TaxID=3093848 RepID=UPI00366FA1CF
MTFFKFAKRLKDDEDGAVTVDWVVLTAATVGLGIAALNMIRGGVADLTNEITQYLSDATVKTAF